MQRFMLVAACLVFAVSAAAQVDLDQSIAWLDPGADGASLYVVPDGSGAALTHAFAPGGGTVDATVHVQLFDATGAPVAGFPADEIEMYYWDGMVALAICPAGWTADGDTDAAGMTSFSLPPRAGGSVAYGGCLVFVAGEPLTNQPSLALSANSPDMNGDLVVNLIDVAMFAQRFAGPYSYDADLNCDGVINLSDISMFAGALGAACP